MTIPHRLPITPLAAMLVALVLQFDPLPARADAPRVAVETARTTEIVEVVPLDGTVNTLREARLSAEIAGLVETVTVESGDRVTAGAPLFTLDAELQRLAVRSLEAERQEAEAARREAERRLEEARSVVAGRHIAETEVRARASAVAVARAREARLAAELEQGEARLARYRIAAPFDGVVVAREAERGEWVEPGDSLLRLVDTDALRLDFQVPQRYHRLMGDDATLRYRPDDAQRDWREADVATVVPVTDPAARTFLLRGQPSTGDSLLPGMAVEGHLSLPTGRKGLTVARDAVQRYPDGRTTIWVLADADESTVVERQVTLADGFGERVVVTEGLKAGDRVIVRGNESLEAGMSVRVDGEGG
ncbi:MAG: efflux RND transporter periplasmic adaptor subunit [Guyparkeria sp.]